MPSLGKWYRPVDPGPERPSAKPDPELVRAALGRILASVQFSRAESLCTLLVYVTEQTLQGHGHELKEYRIGTEALGRGQDFDPKLDGIVRVQATKVRSRLKEYYATDGRAESIIIDLPKGSYRVGFQVRKPPPTMVRFRWRIAATALTILVGVVSLCLRSSPHNDQQLTAIPSIAVFPFADLSPTKDQRHVADAITDDLVSALARSESIRVIARNSIMQYESETPDVRRIGRQLRATVLLKGSVSRNLDKIEVTANLYDTHTGNRVWSTALDSDFASISTAGQAITAGIAAQLGIAPPVGINAVQRSVNPVALDLYRRGLAKLRSGSEPQFYEAIKYFEKALSADPQYALAYAGLAECYTQLGLRRLAPIQDVKEKAKKAVRHALELDPMQPQAHLLWGQIASDFDSNWLEGERFLRRALELAPGSAEVHRSFAQYAAMPAGRFEEALIHFNQAEELDPFNVYLTSEIGRVLYRLRRYPEAIDKLQTAANRVPQFIDTHVWMGLSYLAIADYRRAIAELEKALALADRAPPELAYLSHAVGRSGDRVRAAALHKELASLASRRYVHPKYLAISLLGSGHMDEALAVLRESLSTGSMSAAFAADPIYDSVRSHPGFEALAQVLPAQTAH